MVNIHTNMVIGRVFYLKKRLFIEQFLRGMRQYGKWESTDISALKNLRIIAST